MRYIYDHDLHIHSVLSSCSRDAGQSNERILEYALKNGLSTICLTDHFWDSSVDGASEWYSNQNYDHISKAKPLPQADGVKFLFGCETELNKLLTLGVSAENFDKFDFIVIPTTHFHMKDYTLYPEELATPSARAAAWVKRLDAVLGMELPFHKIGFAHLTCGLIAPTAEEYLEALSLIPENDMVRLFTRIAGAGAGVEINSADMKFEYGGAETVLRPYRIAKECGCKFYLGSDAHHPPELDAAGEAFERAIDMLGLLEDDKFIIA